ncbi:MAG: hypothetical protein ABJF10_03845 [Chthoniobacter sp.]|uniref:hypothetical protein n=1 Tax=Chthoniobacter sp. TaxID=2510640 RepID=UPI0032AD892A
MAELDLPLRVERKPFWRAACRVLILMLVLGGFHEELWPAQFAESDAITQISEVRPVGKNQSSDQNLVAMGFHALSGKEQALVTGLKAAQPLDGIPWNPVKKQLLRSQSGNYYLLQTGEDGETFGISKCVRTGKRYSVPWTEPDPYVGCFHVAGVALPAGEAKKGKAPVAAGMRLVINRDPVGAGLEKYRRTFCDLHDDSPAMKDLLEKLWTEHGERYAGREVSYHGPDHPAVVIAFESHGRRFVLRSWHATYRRNPKAIGTAGGMTWRETEEERQKLFDEQPAEYRQFVNDFDAILNAAEKLGKPFDL